MIESNDYVAKGLFKNGHFSTIYPALFSQNQIAYQRQRLQTPDADFFDVDILPGATSNTLLLLHGLEGSSRSNYIQGMAAYFNAKGFTVYAINFRSCSGSDNLKPYSYHSGFTQDIRLLVQQLTKEQSKVNLLLCGFSLGGNVLLKYLGEEGESVSPQIKAAVAISTPVDLAASSRVLAGWQNTIYMNRFLKSLKSKMITKSASFKDLIDIRDMHHIKTFHQFDNRFTAPLNCFDSAETYYKRCSSKQFLHHIRVPSLLLNAMNDPFLSYPHCFPDATTVNNPYVKFVYPAHGGHVGFVNSKQGSSWYQSRADFFFNQVIS